MNFILTFLGWIGWNWFEFTQAKDEADEKDIEFDFAKYVSKKWDNWVWTAIVATALLFVGHAELGLELVRTFYKDLQWSDLWYLASGFISEVISYAYRRWVKKQSIIN